MDDPKGLAEWALKNVPAAMRADPIWRLPAYRFALYLGDQLRASVSQMRRKHSRRTVDQLLDAVRSISANITEGYGRSSGPERAKFFEYGNSSAREAREWLFEVRDSFDEGAGNAHLTLINRIIAILTAVIPRERANRDMRDRLEKNAKERRAREETEDSGDDTPSDAPF